MDKQRALEAGRKRLTADGFFALVDVFSAESEPRHGYLESWIEHAGTRYAALGQEEKNVLFEHVRARDFPVSLATLEALGKQAGLGRFDVLLQDHARLNCLVTFSRGDND